MSITLPRVISWWGIGNAVLVAMLIGYRESAFGVVMYASSVALIEVVALTAAWSLRHRPDAAVASPAPRHGHLAVVAASAVPFIGLGLIYRPYFLIPAIYPLLDLLVHAMNALHAPEPAVSQKSEPPPMPAPSGAQIAAGAGAAATAVGITRIIRTRRRRRS